MSPWPILALSAAGVGASYLITTKPYPIETIYCAVIVALAGFSLQVGNIVLGCGVLMAIAALVVFGSARPSKTRAVMILFIILAFGGSASQDARAHISELYDVLLAPTDVSAIVTYAGLFTSDSVSVSYARVPLIATASACLVARYFMAFCLAASLRETSYYSLVTSNTGAQKLVASVRAMIYSSGKSNTRSLFLMLILMATNIIAVIVYSILQLIVGEFETGAPILKRAVAAAAHAIQGSHSVELNWDSGAWSCFANWLSGQIPWPWGSNLSVEPAAILHHASSPP